MAKTTSTAYSKSGVPEQATQAVQTQAASSGGSGGGGGGGGYSRRRSGGGGGSATPKDTQKKQQASIDNLGQIYPRKIDQLKDDLANKQKNNQQKIDANQAALDRQMSNIKKQNVWQPQQQKEQSTLMALRNRMGNAAYGSGIVDLVEGMKRVDDMADSELVQTYKNNMNDAYENWYQAQTDIIGDWNADLIDADSQMTEILNQYQAALNNINPELASGANIRQADKNASLLDKARDKRDATAGSVDALRASLAETAGRNGALATVPGYDSFINGGAIDDSSAIRFKALAPDAYGQYQKLRNASKKLAARQSDVESYKAGSTPQIDTAKSAFKKAKKAAKGATGKTAKASAKAAVKKAEAALKKARKANDNKPVSVGSGTDKYTLPNIDVIPSRDFMKKWMENPSRTNPYVPDYIRPDAAQERLGGSNGMFQTATAANTGFTDNLSAFRRV